MTINPKLPAFERLERFCRKFCVGAGGVDITVTEEGNEVLWSIRGIVRLENIDEEEKYYGSSLLDCISQMPK